MNLKPLHDRVIVERREKETKTASGIVLASSAAEKPSEGVVVAAGPGKSHDGNVQPLTVKEGDRVLFGKFTGSEVKVDGKDYVIMREDEIFAIIE